EISDVKEIGDSYYIIKPVEKTEPAVLEFEKAKESVKKDLTEDLQREAAQKDAQSFLASLEDTNDIQKAARETDLKVTTTEFFTRNGNIPQLGNSPEIVKAAFKLTKENMICQKVLKSNGNFYIISFNEKKVPDQAKIDENLTREKKQLAIKKQNSTYAAWIKELKANGTIEIEQGIID
ncbi:MAG: peptidyl-prolyl cis-trans isomerase, partial [Thermodesulfobacteriota bacterium]|nr:peptidyl-prolyl cis-trans isomerase [Thermodesulfobacteriota bacterium]